MGSAATMERRTPMRRGGDFLVLQKYRFGSWGWFPSFPLSFQRLRRAHRRAPLPTEDRRGVLGWPLRLPIISAPPSGVSERRRSLETRLGGIVGRNIGYFPCWHAAVRTDHLLIL